MQSIKREIVDTHHHLWDRKYAEMSWLNSDYGLLYDSFNASDYSDVATPVGVIRSVVVEAGNTEYDNQYLEKMADSSDVIGAFIANVELTSSTIDEDLDELQRNVKFRGVRMNMEGNPDRSILSNQAILNGLSTLSSKGLIYEFLVRTYHLSDLLKVYEKTPDLKGVINHMAKPDMANGSDQIEWQSKMKDLADNTDIYCKISLSPRQERIFELASESGASWQLESIRPYVQWLLECFGPGRLMWGSDWPIALITSGYEGIYDLMRQALGTVEKSVEDQLFKSNAFDFYRLE